jgi:hypothetical protein
MKDIYSKKQNLVSSRESTPTKDVGTAIDATTIQVICKSVQFHSKCTHFEQQSSKYTDKNKPSKNT